MNESFEDLLESVGSECREPEAASASENVMSSREVLKQNAEGSATEVPAKSQRTDPDISATEPSSKPGKIVSCRKLDWFTTFHVVHCWCRNCAC